MEQKTKRFHSLARLEDFKDFFGADDRDDDFIRHLLVSATNSIEGYCMRRLYARRIVEGFALSAANIYPLFDYPVRSVICIAASRNLPFDDDAIIAPENYYVSPDAGTLQNTTHYLNIIKDSEHYNREKILKAAYYAGYLRSDVPADLKHATLELAAHYWQRIREQRKDEAGLIPDFIYQMLVPYKRATL